MGILGTLKGMKLKSLNVPIGRGYPVDFAVSSLRQPSNLARTCPRVPRGPRRVRDREEEEEAVAAVGPADVRGLEPGAEADVLRVAEALLDREAAAVASPRCAPRCGSSLRRPARSRGWRASPRSGRRRHRPRATPLASRADLPPSTRSGRTVPRTCSRSGRAPQRVKPLEARPAPATRGRRSLWRPTLRDPAKHTALGWRVDAILDAGRRSR